jgi:hypothetical protein
MREARVFRVVMNVLLEPSFRPAVAGYIACNGFSSGCQSNVQSSRSKKSLVGMAIIRLSSKPVCALIVVCVLFKLSFSHYVQMCFAEVTVG